MGKGIRCQDRSWHQPGTENPPATRRPPGDFTCEARAVPSGGTAVAYFTRIILWAWLKPFTSIWYRYMPDATFMPASLVESQRT